MMKAVVFLVLALAVAVSAQQVFPKSTCFGAPANSAGNVDLAAPVFVGSGSSLSSSNLILNFNADARYRSIAFQFTTGSQGQANQATSCDWSINGVGATPADPSSWTSADTVATPGCTDPVRFTANFVAPQTALGQCFNYDNTTDPNFVFYTAVIKITTEQNRAQIRNTPVVRTVTTAVQLRFRFQRFITVNSSSLTVVGNANILSDIIEQTFDTNTQLTKVVIFTSVQQPYQLTLNGAEPTTVTPAGYTFQTSIVERFSGNNGINGANAGIQACTAGGVNNLGAVTSAGSSLPTACSQKWEVVLAAPANTCLFNAVVTFNFRLNVTSDYVGSFAGISSISGGNTYQKSYTFASNDFCAKVVDDISLSGTLTPYGTPITNPTAPGNPLFNYLFGQKVYFLAFVQASAGPAITSTNFDSAVVTSLTAVPKVVNFNLATQNDFLGFGKTNYVSNGQPQYASFWFLIDELTVQLDNFDVAQPVTVSAVFRVDYQNLGNSGSSAVELSAAPKFRSMTTGSSGLNFKTDFAVTRPATATGSSSLVAMVAGIAAGCVALTAFVALFLYRRSTKKFADQISAPVDPKELEAIENRLANTAV